MLLRFNHAAWGEVSAFATYQSCFLRDGEKGIRMHSAGKGAGEGAQ